jgi:hypothetical protein
MSSQQSSFLWLLALCVLLQRGARAQSSARPFDAGFGITVSGPGLGVAVQAGWRAGEYAALVGEGSVYRGRPDTSIVERARVNHIIATLAGVRLSTGNRILSVEHATDTTLYRPFAQLLGGPEGSTVLPTFLALQPGIGVDLKFAGMDGWFRFAYDYRFTRGGPAYLSGGRVSCLLVLAPPLT